MGALRAGEAWAEILKKEIAGNTNAKIAQPRNLPS
jgi:hypothetical protein